MSDYELYIETDEGIKCVTSPLTKPPRRSVGPATEETPKKKGVKKHVDTDQT